MRRLTVSWVSRQPIALLGLDLPLAFFALLRYNNMAHGVEQCRAALQECPPGHPRRSACLSNLASSLRNSFQQRGIPSDLDESIELHRAALALPFGTDSSNGVSPSDLNESIELLRVALALRPLGHSRRSSSLNNLAISLGYRFQQQGVLSDLDESIELLRAALALRPPGHHHRYSSLNNLAISLGYRFQQRGVLPDLNESIELLRIALMLCPPGHSDRSSSLNNLAISLEYRFRQRGVLSDLDESIELHRAALALRPPGHSHRSASLSNLAISLRDRFQQQGVLPDLDESIELHRAALALCPPSHSDRSSSLNNLAISLRYRFQQRGLLSDLDESIELHRAALTLCHPGHYDRSSSLNNLAVSLRDRFQQRGVLSDLNEAVELNRAACMLCPPGHSDRSSSLHNLANTLQARFQRQLILSDLDESIELHRAALVFLPPGHSERRKSLNDLAICLPSALETDSTGRICSVTWMSLLSSIELPWRFVPLATVIDPRFSTILPSAFKPDSIGMVYHRLSHAVSRSDFRAAKSWAASAEQLKHNSALIAYQTTLKFLDEHVAVLASSPHHFDVVREASSLAMDAFSCSVRHGVLTTAVELVERGRAVFWTQMVRFRTLSASGGEALEKEFMQLSFRLRHTFKVPTEDQSLHIQQLAVQLDDVISRIRMLPGLSRFLLPQLFSDLQRAAEGGPVIIVNASQYSCDALIIPSAHDPVHVSLDITRAEVSELSSEFQSLTECVGSSDHQLESNKMIGVLRTLWHRVVNPVVQALGGLVRPHSRIWWCPTAEFTLLPLHAAGPYEGKSHDGKKNHNLSHFYISSYIPTLAELIRARQQVSRDTTGQHFVAIGQANPDGAKLLRCVATELSVVSQCLSPLLSFTPPTLSFTQLADNDATVRGVFDALSQNQWLHLACHGMPNRKQPFESSFAMRDGPLTIREIMRSDWQNPEFAFLSACHTTVGDELSPDEAIHLAAAMQFSGFRSVIGSMWSVDDNVVAQIASAFYKNLIDGSGRLECTRAAVALHKAVKTLRKGIPLEQRIVFIHIGV
ncbi:TPR-like protein [Suillus paluster]|uniref:TPR-like protein n=1 Tax=Suillus paluster TaxID=48578 RepID=UPI001B881FD3|nr:TPR-like protein [Suillus paluster]KAG1728368.1 TPR-like protein [Suillus paluster]